MDMLTRVFSQLLSMGLTALPVMAVVLAVRCVLGRVSRRCCYALWAVVAFRLVCPAVLTTPVGLVEPVWAEQMQTQYSSPAYIGGIDLDGRSQQTRSSGSAGAGEPSADSVGNRAVSRTAEILALAAVIWLVGVGILTAYSVGAYLRLRRRVAMAVRLEDGVWESDGVSVPFVMGLLHPRIYIPFRLSDEERAYIFTHERIHIRRGDPWTKLLSLVLLAVYWWHPGVWLCRMLFCRDMEMRCDEAVLAELGEGAKTGYSRSLVSFAQDRRTPAVVAFGEHDASRRVRNVLRWRQAGPWALFLAVSAVIIVAVICGTNADSGSWVQVESGEAGGCVISWDMKEPIRAWAIYEDIYEDGVLISSELRLLDGFSEDGTGATPRKFTGTLTALPDLSGELACRFGSRWSVEWTIQLPKERYTGAGWTIGEGGTDGILRKTLKGSDQVVLMSVLYSTKPTGSITGYHRDLGVAWSNDTAVQFRLVTADTMEAVEHADGVSDSLAHFLYARRMPGAEDDRGLDRLIRAMDWDGALRGYSWELLGPEEPHTLQLDFDDCPADQNAWDSAMMERAALLLALVEDLEQVNWSYPVGETLYTVYFDRKQPDAWAERMGYVDIKDLGNSVEGIQALLVYLPIDGDALGAEVGVIPRETPAAARLFETP